MTDRRPGRLNLRREALIALGFFLLPLAFFWQVTLGGRTLLPADNLYQFQPYAAYRDQVGVPDVAHNMLLSDLVLENWQWKHHIRESLAGGEIPLWTPYIFGGAPFLAAGQHSALYPFSLIYYMLPLENAYGWFTVSQLWLAGWFMYLFLRGLGAGRSGAALAGMIFQFSGFFLASVVFQMIIAGAAWLPFLLLMVEFAVQGRPFPGSGGKAALVPWIVGGALGIGMVITAGHAEFVYYSLLVMAFWAACRLGIRLLCRQESLRVVIGRGVALLILVIAGMSVGAVQFVPFVEVANASFREGRASFSQVRGYALPPRHALTFLMPNLFGSPAQHEYFDLFSGATQPVDWEIDGARITDTMMPGGKNYVEGAAYVGVLTLILASIGALAPRRRESPPYRAIFVLLAAICVLFAFGTPLYAVLYYGLPGFNQLHSPFRWVFPLTLCLAALAGFGLEALIAARPARGAIFRWAGRIGWLMWIGGTLTVIGLLVSRIAFESLRGPLDALYNGLAGANLAYPSLEVFYSVKARDVLIFGLATLAGGAVLIAYRHLKNARLWQGTVFAVILADLVVASAGFNPAVNPAWLHFEPPAITWLKAQNPAEWRYTALEYATHTLNANSGWRFGLQDVRGYDSIIPRQYVEFMNTLWPQNQLLYNRIAALTREAFAPDASGSTIWDANAWRLASVRYIVSEIELPDRGRDPEQYPLVYQDEAVYIYENRGVLPRAYWYADAGLPDLQAVQAASVNAASLVEAKMIQVVLNVTTPIAAALPGDDPTPIRLVLTDSYAPGWRAYYRPQGAPEDAEIEIPVGLFMDGNARTVELPAGAWTVRFRYSPPSFQVGAFVTFLALASLLFGGMLYGWRSLYRETGGEASASRRLLKNTLAPILLNLFNRGIDLAFAFIMLRVLGPANAGTYYYAIVIFGWFDILTNFGLNTLLTREVARDRAGAGRYLFNSGVLRLGLAGAGVPLLIGFLAVRGALEPLDPVAVACIVLLYVGLLPNSISTGLTALFYAFEKAEVPAAVSTITAILKAAFGLGVLLLGWGVIGLAGVSILLNVITLAVLAWSARGLSANTQPVQPAQAERPGLDRALLRGMIGAGFPLMLNHLLATLFFKVNVVLLEVISGATIVGLYSTAYKWIDALGVIPSFFTMALLPRMARQAAEDRSALRRDYQFGVKALFSLAVPVAVLSTMTAYWLIGLLGGARYLPDGAIALQIMIWFALIGWINSLTNYVLIALDQQRQMRWAFLAGLSFNVIANLIFIPQYGYRAAAVIATFSELVLLIMFYQLLRGLLGPIPWLSWLWKFVAAGAIMALAGVLIWEAAPVLAVMAAALVYAGALIVLRPFDAWETSRLRSILPARLRRA